MVADIYFDICLITYRLFQISRGGEHFVRGISNSLPGGHSELEPPDPISNSEVKRLCADDSVGSPHVKVGHRQAPNPKPS